VLIKNWNFVQKEKTVWNLSLCTELIERLSDGILVYYINMGASQFLRDFRRAALVKKSAELRKRVLQRKEKTREKTDSVSYNVRQQVLFLFNIEMN